MEHRSTLDASRCSELDGHRLQPLLAPRSVAIVGASDREQSFGWSTVRDLLDSGYPGAAFAVNPRYKRVQDLPCYPSLDALPKPPDLAIMCVANERLEAEMLKAAECGIPAAVIFASGYLAGDNTDDSLLGRLRRIAREADIQVCGGNCLGLRNLVSRTHAGFVGSQGVRPGPVALISHSGTAYGQMGDLDGRVGYTMMVSAGQEHSCTAADYMDYALCMPQTRCLAIFLEAIRDPERFVAALERARCQAVPVVVLKVGKSAAAARFAVSHSGALVGNDAAYQALFDRHGVIRVHTLDAMANAIQLLCYGRPLSPGGLTAFMDSGGKRELLMDLVETVGVPVANIAPSTVKVLADNLDPGLEPVNPLDFWGSGDDWEQRISRCAVALAEDSDSALCAMSGMIDWHGSTHYVDFLCAIAKRTEQPVAMLTEFLCGSEIFSVALFNALRIPVLVGERSGLEAIKAVMDYRDYLARPPHSPPHLSAGILDVWRERLRATTTLDETQSLNLLTDIGISTPQVLRVDTEEEALAAAATLGYPVVVKTAMPGIQHKSDVDGVKLAVGDPPALRLVYRDLQERLGSRVLITRQIIHAGVEMALGVVNDPVVGPVVMVGAGGTLIELLDDKACVLAPSNAHEARCMLDGLKIHRLLTGHRGGDAMDMEALVRAIVNLSLAAAELRDVVSEIDVNPLLVTADGCLALDALVVARAET